MAGGIITIELGWPAKWLSLSPNTARSRRWSEEETALLRAAYENASAGEDIGLDDLAAKLGRHKTNVSRKARALGLTNISRPLKRQRKDRRKYGDRTAFLLVASQVAKEAIAKHGHPRGMLGKKHTAELRRQLGDKASAYWAALTEGQRQAVKDKMQRAAREAGPPQVARGSWKAGWREIGGRRNYYRSRWEANYARWLQSLKDRGEIVDWEFEPRVFWFDKIKRGVRSYKPDFRVTGGISPDDVTWHEVKGWMDARSKTTLKRMAKYHPDEVIILIREKQMKSLGLALSGSLEGWE